jgi:hypothetical protein
MGGAGPIPWDVVAAYCDRERFNRSEYEEFYFLITSLDEVFLSETKPKGKMKPKPQG